MVARKGFTYRSLSLESRRCSSEQPDGCQNERTGSSQPRQWLDRGTDHQESHLNDVSLRECLSLFFLYGLTTISADNSTENAAQEARKEQKEGGNQMLGLHGDAATVASSICGLCTEEVMSRLLFIFKTGRDQRAAMFGGRYENCAGGYGLVVVNT